MYSKGTNLYSKKLPSHNRQTITTSFTSLLLHFIQSLIHRSRFHSLQPAIDIGSSLLFTFYVDRSDFILGSGSYPCLNEVFVVSLDICVP